MSLGDAVTCFLRMACLLYDTNDAYKMADGERCIRNEKLEWLYASATRHYKYQIWLWRMISYTIALLSPRESFEYKWNISTNLVGGVDKNFPNDNCVELQVKTIKNQVKTQGANKSFNSARTITLTTQYTCACPACKEGFFNVHPKSEIFSEIVDEIVEKTCEKL